MTYYPKHEQDSDYRDAAREAGCTCPDLPPHVHREDCPLYSAPGVWVKITDAADIPLDRDVIHVRMGEDGYLEMLDQQHDADEGRPWI